MKAIGTSHQAVAAQVARAKEAPRPPGWTLVRFMEARGRRISEGCGALWYSTTGRFYMSAPLELRLDPDPALMDELLRRTGGLGLRFPSLTLPGLPGGLYVCRKRGYDFRAVHHGLRSKVNRGMSSCAVREIERAELAGQGLRLNLDTMRRQERMDPEFADPRRWARLVQAIYETPQIGAIGSFVGDQLAAYAITCREGGWLHLLHRFSRADLLEHCPNHALDFQLTMQALRDPAIEAVSMGWISLLGIEGLHAYKTRMGYEVAAQNVVIRMRAGLEPLLANRFAVAAASLASRLRPSSQSLKLVAAVVGGARASRGAPVARVAGPYAESSGSGS